VWHISAILDIAALKKDAKLQLFTSNMVIGRKIAILIILFASHDKIQLTNVTFWVTFDS